MEPGLGWRPLTLQEGRVEYRWMHTRYYVRTPYRSTVLYYACLRAQLGLVGRAQGGKRRVGCGADPPLRPLPPPPSDDLVLNKPSIY